MENRFNKYFKYYLSLLFLFSCIYLTSKHDVGNDSTISEWLINYAGGFTKRGLIGQISIILANYFEANLRDIVLIFQVSLIGLYLLLKSGTSYQALDSRENFVLVVNNLDEETKEFKAFPNPVTNQFTLELAEENDYTWQLQSLSGGLVLEGRINGNVLNANLSNLPNAVYVLAVKNTSKVVWRQKIIKK